MIINYNKYTVGTEGFEPPTKRFRLVTNPNESKFKEF